MKEFPKIAPSRMITRLEPPTGAIEMILDTDTDNEIDDQFALTYALLSQDKLKLHAVYAAPYHNNRSAGPGDGMSKSYDEILRVLEQLGHKHERFAFRGSTGFLPGANESINSDAVQDLIQRSMSRPVDGPPLYVVAIGAITNIASAILLEPRIIERIVVVWLGGHPFYWPNTREFNMRQDLHASKLMFDSGVPLVLVPCKNVAEHLRMTRPEVDRYILPHGKIGAYLQKIYSEQVKDEPGHSRVIWDVSTIAWLINPDWVPSSLFPSPILTDQVTWSIDPRRHLMRCATDALRDLIFADLYRKLETHAARKHL